MRFAGIIDGRRDAPGRRRLAAHGSLVCALGAACALVLFPPTRFALYPACPFHAYLGVLCPGCGATRALAALLHGHLLEAVHQNALFVGLLPLALTAAMTVYVRAIRPGDFRWPRVPTPMLGAALLAAAAFTVARNVAR